MKTKFKQKKINKMLLINDQGQLKDLISGKLY